MPHLNADGLASDDQPDWSHAADPLISITLAIRSQIEALLPLPADIKSILHKALAQ